MRELLWRLIDPSLGFGFVVRRALYTQRVMRVLQAATVLYVGSWVGSRVT